MTEHTYEYEIIAQANEMIGAENTDHHVSTILDACETIYGHGFADDTSGDVEAPSGHFYRVSRWIVRTDTQGFKTLESFTIESAARDAFAVLEREFAKWGSDDETFTHAFTLYAHDCLALAEFLRHAASADPAGASFDVSDQGNVRVHAAGLNTLAL